MMSSRRNGLWCLLLALLPIAASGRAEAAPDLVVTQITAPPTANETDTISVSWTVQNMGDTTAAAPWTDKVQVSRDNAIGSDIFIANFNIGAPLGPGETYTRTEQIPLPQGAFGDVWIVIETDTANNVPEGPGEGNNTAIDDAPIAVTPVYPDVYIPPESISVPAIANPNSTITVSWQVTNLGGVAANWQAQFVTPTWRIYLSTDTIAGNGDDVQIDSFGLSIPGGNILDPGESQTMSRNIVLPQTTTGTRYIVVRCDQNNHIAEGPAGEGNNNSIDPDPLEIPEAFPDLVVTNITVNPETAVWGQNVTVTWTVENQGTAPAPASTWNDYLRASTDMVVTSGDPFISNVTRPAGAANLAPGASYQQSATFRFLENFTAPFYFFVIADYNGQVGEGPTGENNNFFDDVLTPVLNADVFIPPESIVVPATPNAGSVVTVQWSVTNLGMGFADWTNQFVTPTWRIFLSTDDIGGNGDDVQIDSFGLAIPGGNILDPGETQAMTRNVTLPQGTTGPRYVVVRCDQNNHIPEGTAGEANNNSIDVDVMDIQAAFPDLVVTNITVNPETAVWGQNVTVTWTVENQGTAPAPASTWNDYLRASTDMVVTSGDPFISSVARPAGAANLAPGASYQQSATFRFLENFTAPFYFFVVADTNGQVGEGPTGENNNFFDDVLTPVLNADVFIPSESIVVPATPNAGSVVTVQWSVTNLGMGYADWTNQFVTPTWRIFLSTDMVGGNGDDVQIDSFGLAIPGGNILDPGETQAMTRNVTLPQGTTGPRYVVVRCDQNNHIPEGTAGEANNNSIDVDVMDIQAAFPDLVVTSITVNPETAVWGQNVTVTWTVENQGTAPAPASTWNDYLRASTDLVVTSGDPFISNVTRPAGAANLAPGASYQQSATFRFLENFTAPFYFFVVADYNGQVGEGPKGENNNFFDDVLTPVLNADVFIPPESIEVQPFAEPNSTITVQWSVTNLGMGYADWTNLFVTPTWRIFLSTDTVGGNGDDVQIASFSQAIPAGNILDPGEMQVLTRSVALPAGTTGTRYIVVRCDQNNHIPEGTAGEANNNSIDPDSILIQSLPNLIVPEEGISVPTNVSVGQMIQVSWTVQNSGNGPASGTWTDEFLLSTDRVLGNDIALGSASFTGTLGAGESYVNGRTITVPPEATGVFYFLVRTDTTNIVFESNENDNFGFDIETFTGNRPDLTPQMVAAPSSAALGSSIQITWNDANIGPGDAIGSWFDRVVLSMDGVFGNEDDIILSTQAVLGPVASGMAAARALNMVLPAATPIGDYNVLVRVDSTDAVPETDESNNVGAAPMMMSVVAPDLRPTLTDVSVPASALAGTSLPVQWTEENAGNAAAMGNWSSRLVLSPNTVFGDGDDAGLVTVPHTGPLGAGASVIRSTNLAIPAGADGLYYVIARSDFGAAVTESDETNNTLVLGQVAVGRPDLIVAEEGRVVPPSAAAGEPITVQWKTRNIGNATAPLPWNERVVLSPNAVYGDADDVFPVVIAATAPLEAGSDVMRSATMNNQQVFFTDFEGGTPPQITGAGARVSSQGYSAFGAGSWYWANTSAGNPAAATTLTLTNLPPHSALSITALLGINDSWDSAGSFGPDYFTIRVDGVDRYVYTPGSDGGATLLASGENYGGNPGWANDAAYDLSSAASLQYIPHSASTVTIQMFASGPVWQGGDDESWAIDNLRVSVILSAGAEPGVGGNDDGRAPEFMPIEGAAKIVMPAGSAGNYNVIVRVDSSGNLAEANEDNNTAIIGSIQVSAPDLVPLAAGAVVPAAASPGQSLAIQWSERNDGSITANGPWSDRIVLSTNSVYGDGDDIASATINVPGPLAPGATGMRSANLTVPSNQMSGTFNVIVRVDSSNNIFEVNEANNVLVLGQVTVAVPDLIAEGGNVTPNSVAVGQSVLVQWTERNIGAGPAVGSWVDRVVLSTNTVFGDGDDVGGTNVNVTGPIAPGDTAARSTSINVPSVTPGMYNVLVRVDNNNQVAETNNDNNSAVLGTIQVGAPDLVASDAAAPSSGITGTPLMVSWTVTNSGSATAFSPWTDRVFISTDMTLGGDTVGASVQRASNLVAAASYNASASVTLPSTPGEYYFIVFADALGQVAEPGAEGNNTSIFGPITVSLPPNPDLAVTSVIAPPSATAGDTISMSYTVMNVGTEPAAVNWQDAIYLSSNATFDGGDELVRLSPANQAPLAPGASYSFTRNIALPISFTTSTAYLIVRTDSANAVVEQSESNNTGVSGAITVQAAPAPDLLASGVTAPSNATFGEPITVSWSVNNNGTADAPSPWSDAVFLSTNPTLETTDRLLGSQPYAGPALPFGGPGYNAMLEVILPVDQTTTPGNYYVLVKADGFGGIAELNENNNVAAFGPIAIDLPPLPNVQVTELTVPATGEVGQNFAFTFRISNVGPLPATGSWLNEVRLVPVGGGTSPIVAVTGFNGTINPGESSPIQNVNFALPDIGNTAFRVSVETNIDRTLLESTTADNKSESSPATDYLRPDLRAVTILGPESALADQSISVQYGVMNEGSARALPFWIDAVYLSADQNVGNDILLGTRGETSTLLAGGSYMRSFNVTIPSALQGTYYLVIETDRGDRIIESGVGNTNNFAVSMTAITIDQPPRPNLIVESVSTPEPGLSGTPMEVTWVVRNIGMGAANGFWTDRVWLSTNNILDPTDVRLNDFASPMALNPGESYSLTRTLAYPSAPGQYHLIVQTDFNSTLNEGIAGGENDNHTVSVSPLTVSTFVATAVASLESAPAGSAVTITGDAIIEETRAVAPHVPVVVRVNTGGFERRITTNADAMGHYEAMFQPGPTEGGLYNVAAGPEHSVGLPPSDAFSLWSLIAQPTAQFVTANPSLVSQGQFMLRNPGNQAQSGLLAMLSGVPEGVDIQLTINPSGSPMVGPNAAVPVTYSVLATQELAPFLVPVTITSAEGATTTFNLNLRVLPTEPALALVQEGLTGGRLSVNVLRGTRTFTQFKVQNLGTGATGPITINVPALSWMRLATASPLPSLGPGEVATIVIQLDPPSDTPLATYSGAFGAQAATTGVNCPFRFTVVSAGFGDLLVRATDEFTYYAEGAPFVSGASVTVKNQGTNTIAASGLTDANGEVLFEGLTEAYYDLEVRAANHGTFRSTLLVGGGDVTEVEAFMPRQLVNYTWSVTPTDFQDVYTITIQATFATQVPAPVMVIEPAYVNLTNIPLPTQINYTITNHGLIAARDYTFTPGTSNLFTLVPLVTDLGDIPGQSSVTVPVLVIPTGNRGSCSTAVSFGCHNLQCGPSTFTYCLPAVTTTGNCSSGPGSGSEVGPLPGFGGGPGGGGGPSGGGGSDGIIENVPYVSQPIDCDPCTIKCVFSGIGCIPGAGCAAGLAGSGATFDGSSTGAIIGSAAGVAGAGVNCVVNLTPIASQLSCLCSLLRDCALCQFTGPGPTSFIPCSPGDIIGAIGAGIGAAIGRPERGIELPDLGNPARNYYYRLYTAFGARWAIFVEIYGETKWIEGLDSTNADAFVQFIAAWQPATDPEGPSGMSFSESERLAILAAPLPGYLNAADVEAFVARWNRSMDYHAQGILSEADLPQGWNDDFIDFFVVRDLFQFAAAVEQEVLDDEFATFSDALLYARNVLYADATEGGEGVCARVRIQIDQTLTVTRTAFNATLTLENEGSSPLEGVSVQIMIRDEDGIDRVSRFGIFPPELSGALTAVNGTGTLPGMSEGTANWVILPTNEAAPLEPVRYWVSGVLQYTNEGHVTTVPLFPILITVTPDPSLQLKYFLETVVYADDPFTPELEPSIPFSLGLIVKNNGAGIARNLTITSSQPQIIENDRGLLIDFDIIGTQVGTQQINPSLTVNLGDIGPAETNVARWLLISTLQGEFTSYTATFQHVTGLGDPRLSLIESVDIFGLNHVVRDVRPGADVLPDFLTDDFPDPRDLPDHVHLSTGDVDPAQSYVDSTATPGPGSLQATVNVEVGSGWNYIRVPDPFNAALRLSSVVRSDGTPILLPDNAWQTNRINRLEPGSPVERYIHIFDRSGTGQYTLTFDPDTMAPFAFSIASVAEHGSGVGEAALMIDPDMLFSESRGQGLSKLVYSFSESIDPGTWNAVTIVVDGFDLEGNNVDLSGVTEIASLKSSDTVGVIVFDPPLPPHARYCIQLIGVKDLSGNLVAGAAQRLDIAVMPGDASGDGRVNNTDVGGVGSLLDTDPIDREALYQVRSDMNLDGRIDNADVQIALANRRTDARNVPPPCLVLNYSHPGDLPPGDAPIVADRSAPGAAGNGPGEPENPFASDTSPSDPAIRRVLAYEFAGTQKILAFDDSRLAIFDPAGGRDVPGLLDELGISGSHVTEWPVEGWWAVSLPTTLAAHNARRDFSQRLNDAGLRVSPVLIAEDGSLIAPAGRLYARFKEAVPLEWAEKVIAHYAGSDATASDAGLGVGGAVIVESPSLWGEALMDLASILNKRSDIEFAEPEMVFVTSAAVAAPDISPATNDGSFREVALIGEAGVSTRIDPFNRALALHMPGRVADVSVITPLITLAERAGGSTSMIVDALRRADQSGSLLAIVDLNLPYGSKAVAATIDRLRARGMAFVAPTGRGMIPEMPGVIADPDIGAERLAAAVLTILLTDADARVPLMHSGLDDAAFDAVASHPSMRGVVALPGDATGDGVIDIRDTLEVIEQWGRTIHQAGASADLNADGIVDANDLTEVLEAIIGRGAR